MLHVDWCEIGLSEAPRPRPPMSGAPQLRLTRWP
jgi:hypothetical protein